MLQLVFTIPNAGVVIVIIKCIFKVIEGVSFIRLSVRIFSLRGNGLSMQSVLKLEPKGKSCWKKL